MDEATESYIMLLLSDANLPTGSFVASAGLESYVKHGFFGTFLSTNGSLGSSTSASTVRVNQAVVNFIEDNLGSYAHSALPFVSDAHIVVMDYYQVKEDASESTLRRLASLDELYHSMILNDVTRRASKAQGVALLTLFSRGFTKPQLLTSEGDTNMETRDKAILQMVDEYKLRIRRGDVHGHLPICWGILTAALGLGLRRSQYLHLFLQARSVLSASIRLNTLGPYAAQQLLLHVVKGIVEKQMEACQNLRSGLLPAPDGIDGEIIDNLNCAASTWPLGEILASRHDLQHSRIFNS